MSTYGIYHKNKRNLVTHLMTVPVFIGGNMAMAWSLWNGEFLGGSLWFGLAMAALALQAKSHRYEENSVASFKGPADFFRRLYLEQFFKFPAYVFSSEFRSHWQTRR